MQNLIFVCLMLLLTWSSGVEAQTSFFHGKTMTVVVGTKAGDAYDLYARLLAQFLPKYIPGNPNVIVQNMSGGGSMIAANFVYSVAKPDGLTLGAIFPALYFDQLVGRTVVQYDWKKFSWIGNTVTSNYLLYMRADTAYRSMDDIRAAAEPPKCGSTGTGVAAYYLPKLLEEIFGMKFNVVLGYQGGGEIDLAVERGEIQCRSFSITAFFAREPFTTWRKKGFVRVLLQTGKKKDGRLPDVPTIYELMDRFKTPEAGRRLATVVLAGGDIGRPIVAPPGLPTERQKLLREAFSKSVQDAKFLEEAKKRKLEIDPIDGAELEQLAKEVIDQPPEVIERMKKLLSN
ncbi:MAG: hypothetical protein HY695_38460 [Deltaproteobacteria bacterium]|nr:hypothetical protein [Deltaproteobacteria bacterium]